jgi:hypothetical protein
LGSYRARDLRDFNGVRQPVAEMIGVSPREHLGFGFQPAECPRVDYPVTIALKVIPVGMLRLRIATSAAALYLYSKVGQHESSLAIALGR